MKRFSLVSKLLVLSALCMGAGMISAPKVSAGHIPPQNTGTIPQYIRDYFNATCGHSGQSPAFAQWVSAAGAPATLTITVPYGTPSVPLDLHFAGEVCTDRSGVHETGLFIMSAAGYQYQGDGSLRPFGNVTVSGGQEMRLNFDPFHQSLGYYRHNARRINFNGPAGGFTASALYRVQFDNRVINQFSPTNYGCVAGGGRVFGYSYPLCPSDAPGFNILINVSNPPTPPTIVCGNANVWVGGNFANPEVGEPFTLQVGFTHSGGTGGGGLEYSILVDLAAAGLNDAPAAYRQATFHDSGYGGGSLPNAIRPQLIRINQPGRHDGTFTVIMPGAQPYPQVCPFSVTVVSKPYYKVYGGDLTVGGGVQTGTGCPVFGNAIIVGLNRNSAPHTGAGSQLAASALSIIYGFATGQIRAPNDPKYLSFANTTNFNGGSLNPNYARCRPDFFANRAGVAYNSDILDIQPNVDGVVNRTGDLRIRSNPASVGLGRHITIYVDGNAFIENNIQFGGPGDPTYANQAEIPTFRLIVSGNIYVAPNVNRLDGLYVAQPRSGSPLTTGWFHTCGRYTWTGRTPLYVPTDAEIFGECQTNKLQVFGSVVADTIKLNRSQGSLRNATTGERYNNNNAAEVFTMSPDVWMGGDLPRGEADSDAVIPLPPVL